LFSGLAQGTLLRRHNSGGLDGTIHAAQLALNLANTPAGSGLGATTPKTAFAGLQWE
jgi:hypothetical protein